MTDSDKIKLLVKKRKALGLTNEEFAGRLGVDQGLWSRIRRGERRLGSKLPLMVAARFPDLREFFLPK